MICLWLGAHGLFCFGDYDHDLVAFHMVLAEEAISRWLFAGFSVRPYWHGSMWGLNFGTDSEPKPRDVKSPNPPTVLLLPPSCACTTLSSFPILSSAFANRTHLLRRLPLPSPFHLALSPRWLCPLPLCPSISIHLLHLVAKWRPFWPLRGQLAGALLPVRVPLLSSGLWYLRFAYRVVVVVWKRTFYQSGLTST